VQETASCLPVLSKDTCFTARGWSRSVRLCVVSLTLTILTTSSLEPLALAGQGVLGDLLARYSDPVSVWTQSHVSNWQRGPFEDLLKLVAIECVFAHCAILGPGNEEAVLRLHQYSLFRTGVLGLHQLQWLYCLLDSCPL
jgi:hypothetical protein